MVSALRHGIYVSTTSSDLLLPSACSYFSLLTGSSPIKLQHLVAQVRRSSAIGYSFSTGLIVLGRVAMMRPIAQSGNPTCNRYIPHFQRSIASATQRDNANDCLAAFATPLSWGKHANEKHCSPGAALRAQGGNRSFGVGRLANWLCRGQEKNTMRGPEVEIGNSSSEHVSFHLLTLLFCERPFKPRIILRSQTS